MKIICVGRNYVAHINELQNEVPADPVVFLKPDTALLKDNKPFYLPEFSEDVHYECELVLKVLKSGKNIEEKFASKYFNEISVGIDFTARDLQSKQKTKGLPWEISKAFDGSAAIGKFISIASIKKPNAISFSLIKNNNPVQNGSSDLMIYSFEKIIAYVSQFFTLHPGDLIFTGTPEGVGRVSIGDRLIASIEQQELLNFEIK